MVERQEGPTAYDGVVVPFLERGEVRSGTALNEHGVTQTVMLVLHLSEVEDVVLVAMPASGARDLGHALIKHADTAERVTS